MVSCSSVLIASHPVALIEVRTEVSVRKQFKLDR